MTDFDPTKHPRAAATGQFATKPQSAPETTLSATGSADAIAAEVEARLDAEVHEDQCACRSWPDSCVNYDHLRWSHSDVDKIVRTTLDVISKKPHLDGMSYIEKVQWISDQKTMDQATAERLAADNHLLVVRTLALSEHRSMLTEKTQARLLTHEDALVRVNFVTDNDSVSYHDAVATGQRDMSGVATGFLRSELTRRERKAAGI